jgi:DNA polymerase-3 subunit delta'
MIKPWQQNSWQKLLTYYRSQRLPHALLLRGITGLGKQQVAQDFAQLLLCQNLAALKHSDFSCGTCYSCGLCCAASHPDCQIIQPATDGGIIKIEQIRQLHDLLTAKPHQGAYRCIIIKPAGAMNNYASNALLKILEEPPPQTVIMLIDEMRTSLAATIISRCQILNFTAPIAATAISWLQQQTLDPAALNTEAMWREILLATYGAPLLALEWQRQGIWSDYQQLSQQLLALTIGNADPLIVAERWHNSSLSWLLNTCLQQLMRMIISQQQPSPRLLAKLLTLATLLQDLLKEISGPYNLNNLLIIELIFIKWVEYTRDGGHHEL